jgi:hypothetical protein
VNLWTLIARSLWHRRLGVLGLVLALALAASGIAGGLIVGDSLRMSVRHALLQRLDGAETAVVSAGTFRGALAADLQREMPQANVRAVLRLDGTLQTEESAAAVGDVTLLGVDQPQLTRREVGIPQSLAVQWNVREGDEVVLGVPRLAAVGEAIFEHRRMERRLRSFRRTVRLLADEGLAHLSLEATHARPANLLLSREALAEMAGERDVANLLLISSAGDMRLVRAALTRALLPIDLGLTIEHGHVHSSAIVMSPAMAEVLQRATPAHATSVYVADRVTRAGGGESAYAVVGTEPRYQLAPAEVVVTDWLAQDVGAAVGDEIEMHYLIPRADGSFGQGALQLRVKQIEPVDRVEAQHMLPPMPGITDADRVDSWQAPFPVDLARVTPRDDDYWRDHRATPKLFIAPQVLQRIWREGGAAGWITGFRVGAAADPGAFRAALAEGALEAGAGLALRDVREEALAAAEGSSDFGSLFAGMSIFLVVSAAAIALTLGRLGVEARAREIGVLEACGFSRARVRAILAMELAAVTLFATLAGVVLAAGYAQLLLHLLQRQAAGTWDLPPLMLHISPASIASALMCCALVGALALRQSMRYLRQFRAAQLLRVWAELPAPRRASKRSRAGRWSIVALLIAALGLMAYGHLRAAASATLFLGSAALLLVSLLALTWRILSARPAGDGPLSLGTIISASLCSRRRGSLLTVILFAVAAFMLASVSMQRGAPHESSGATGGFQFRLTCAMPPSYDLASASGRAMLGFDLEEERALAGARLMALRAEGTGDVSCLNLARPAAARVLGVDPAAMDAAGFSLSGGQWAGLGRGEMGGAVPVVGDRESMTWILKRRLGEVFEMPRDGGKPILVRLVGLTEGGLFAGDLLMDHEAMQRAYGRARGPSVFLVAAAAERKPAVREALMQRLSPLGPRWERVDEIIARVHSVQRLYMGFFIMLGGAGLMLGVAGQLAVLLRQGFERRPELRLLLALGFSRSRCAALIAAEQGVLVTAGVAVGGLAAMFPGLLLMPQASAAGMGGALLLVLVGAVAVVAAAARLVIPAAQRVCLAAE